MSLRCLELGGTKKKSLSAADKSQSSSEDGQSSKKPEKKTAKEAKLAAQQAKQQALVAPKLDDKQMLKTLTPLKAITVYGTARALGLNAAIAAQTLRTLESRSIIKKVGGYSGHYIYAINTAPSTSQ